jgi:hypothetical protein
MAPKLAVTLSELLCFAKVQVVDVAADAHEVPLQPRNDAPATGVAKRITVLPTTNGELAVVHAVPQLMPAGTDMTVPFAATFAPLFPLVTVSVCDVPSCVETIDSLLLVSGSVTPDFATVATTELLMGPTVLVTVVAVDVIV